MGGLMPIVTVNLIEGRPPETLEALLADLTTTVVSTLGVAPESVRVILNEVPPSHWGVAGISRLRQRQQGSST
jgi:4-oxalocrotonate tautomerase